MRQAGDDREVVPEIVQNAEVIGWRVILSRLGREEIVGMQTQRRADANHATWCLLVRGRPGVLRKDIKPGQSERNAGGTDKCAALNLHGEFRFTMILTSFESWRSARLHGLTL